MSENKMLDLCLRHAEVKSTDPLPFSCRGCGNFCCGDLSTPIYVLPPEYLRIQWHLMRNPVLGRKAQAIHAFTLDLEHVSGLPVMKLDFRPFYWQGGYLKACPFLVVDDADENLLLCLVHPARPHTCRVFPVGMTMEEWDGRHATKVSYQMMSYCPGFEIPAEKTATVDGYTPPRPDQTVGDWVENQVHPEQYQEIIYHFFEVMSFYYEMDWHMPIANNQHKGELSQADYNELAAIFYDAPPPPEDPAQDHYAIMQYLRRLRYQAGQIIREVKGRSGLSLF